MLTRLVTHANIMSYDISGGIIVRSDRMSKNRGPMTEAMYYVLLALCSPLHGYAIMNAVAEISQGRIGMGPGTLYGVLTRLEKDKLIKLEEDDGRRKIYQITPEGRVALDIEYQRLTAMVADGSGIVKEDK